MRIAMIFALAILPAPAGAATSPPISDKVLNDTLELGQEIEGRADGDLNGDGAIDTAYVVSSPDQRTVQVLLANRAGARPAYRPAGTLKLEPPSLGPASLSIAKGVLKVEDLSGGTTAIAATYRFRVDPARGKMRLIGLDATLYSRTYAHDGYEISWNLLTGDIVTTDLRLNKGGGDAAYDKVFTRKSKRPSKPLTMEATPDPEMVMIDLRKK